MLIGEFIHLIDAKKRLAIPARFRKEIGERGILTRGLDNCLFLYPTKQWEIFVEKLSSLSLGQSSSRAFVRQFLSGASEVGFDALGRILVPDYLKKHAQLEKKIAVIGVFNRLEIWDFQKWEMYKTASDKNTDAVAEKLGELGFI